MGSFRIAPKDGTRYWHPEYDDGERPEYPQKESDKFKVGTQLNKILRHYIGQDGKKQTNWPRSVVMKVDGFCLKTCCRWTMFGGMEGTIDGNKTMTEGNF